MGVIEEVLRIKDQASGTLNDVADESNKTGAAFGKVAVGAAAVAAGLLAAGAAALKFQQYVADLRNDLTDMSTRTGVTAHALAGLKLAAEGSGLALGDMDSAITAVQMRLVAARRGSVEAVEGFKDLGISASELADIGIEEVLQRTTAHLQAMTDPSERATVALAGLGRGAGKLMQALGDTALDDYILKAELGVDISMDAAAASGEWQRNVAELTLVLDGLASQLSDTTGPAVNTFLGGFTTGLASVGAEIVAVSSRFDAMDSLGELATGGVPGLMRSFILDPSLGTAGFEAAATLRGVDVGQSTGSGGLSFFEQALADSFIGLGGAPAADAGTGGGRAGAAKGKSRSSGLIAELMAQKQAAADALDAMESLRLEGIAKIKDAAMEAAAASQAMADAEQALAAGRKLAAAEQLRKADEARTGQTMGVAGGIATAGNLMSDPGGTITSALSAAGPYGAVAGASLDMLITAGQLGPEGVRKQFEMLVEAIIEGLAVLPEILLQVFPDLVYMLVTELPVAIAKALVRLLIPEDEDRFRLADFGFGGVMRGIKELNKGGGNAEEMNAQRGGVTIVNTGPVTHSAADRQADEMRRQLGPRGRRLSLGV